MVCYSDPLPGKVTLIFELMDMSMYDLLKTRKRCLPESRVKNYLYQILRGIDHLHQHGLFHRDIKPENILLKVQTELVKLADLGSVRGIFCRPPYTEYISTRWYRSPECLLTNGYYGPKMDIWATGCVFFELLTLKPLFPGANEVDQLTKIHNILGTPNQFLIAKFRRHKSQNCKYNFPPKPGSSLLTMLPNVTDVGRDILKHMLVYDPDSRSNARRLLEHRYFTDLREEELLYPRKRSWSVAPRSNSNNNEWRNPVLLSYMMASEKRHKHKHVPVNRHSTENKTIPRVVTSSPQHPIKKVSAQQKLTENRWGVRGVTKRPVHQHSPLSKFKQGEPIHKEMIHLPPVVQKKTEKDNYPPIPKKSNVLNRPTREPSTITSLPAIENSIKNRYKPTSNSFLHLPPLVKKLEPSQRSSSMRFPHNGLKARPGVPTLATIEESPYAKKLPHDLQMKLTTTQHKNILGQSSFHHRYLQ
ncbi:hypothetical protein L9F63_002267 [Diploptera punctata]|uniref:Protein kinase domain-containing protein n=1 Tax=Diploptera punctata TaxID=6984 RepID=A0AAD8A391_DIPPU|nr:hypothetical protein L9F63_002267 [Diploptera punctata]